MRKILSSKEQIAPLTHLTEKEMQLQTEVCDFGNKYIAPLVTEMDNKGELNHDLIKKLHDCNYMNIEIPESYGGRGGTFFDSMIAIEEISKVDPSVGVFIDVQNTLVNNTLLRWGSEQQKKKWLGDLSSGVTGAFSITEKNSGSDAYSMTATAKKVPGGYKLNGEKHFVTNGAEANLFIVLAKTETESGREELTAFLVDKSKTEGFTVLEREEKMGIRASSTCPLLLEDVFLSEETILGKAGLGKRIVLETLTDGRVGIAAQMVGLAEGVLKAAIAYSKERRQFGSRICDFQSVHFLLADMATRVEAARLMAYNAARLRTFKKSQGEYFTAASMAKYLAAEMAGHVTSKALDIFSGSGYLKNSLAEKFYRDAKIGTIYEGTTHMQLRSIAKMVVNFKEK